MVGKVNPPSEWVWSSKPRHEPLTTKPQFDASTSIGKANKGSRPRGDHNTHPATTRTYRLRSYVVCELCGRRLYGETRRVGDCYGYYSCEPVAAHHAGKEWFAAHPKSLWVREDKLLDVVRVFFARRIFGPNRQALLANTAENGSVVDEQAAARVTALKGKIKNLERQQTNVVRELREYQPAGDEDIDQLWRAKLREAFADLAAQRKELDAQLAALTTGLQPTVANDPRLLDQLPITEGDLFDVPEEIERDLFDAFQLEIRYHHPSRRVTVRVTVDGEAIHRLTAMSAAMDATGDERGGTRRSRTADTGGQGFSLAVCAPGGSSTAREKEREQGKRDVLVVEESMVLV